MYACRNGEPEMIQMLLDAKVDPNVQSRDGYTALMGRDGYTALMEACRGGETEMIKMLVNAGADVNARDSMGESALIWAAQFGYTDIMEILLKAGADPSIKDNAGRTVFETLKECHPGKYDRWIQNTIVKSRQQTLKREDSRRSRRCEPDFDI